MVILWEYDKIYCLKITKNIFDNGPIKEPLYQLVLHWLHVHLSVE